MINVRDVEKKNFQCVYNDIYNYPNIRLGCQIEKRLPEMMVSKRSFNAVWFQVSFFGVGIDNVFRFATLRFFFSVVEKAVKNL